VKRSDRLRLLAVKAVHTAVFAAVAASVIAVAWDGLRQRPNRRTLAAATVALGETAVFVGNGFTCPLTPLAERLGAERGSVTDIYLPAWFARRLPLIAGSALLGGLLLNAVALSRSSKEDAR
jgi:hypothetical protein